MLNIKEVEEYFYSETKDIKIETVKLIDTKYSYFDTVQCYLISTDRNIDFYVFSGETTLTNLYYVHSGETLDECYYKHIGFIADYSSTVLQQNFIYDFIKYSTVFPILDRRLKEIAKEITLEKNANQLSGIANQIRDSYITLTNFLMNKVRSKNPKFKSDNFKDNLSEFLILILPGSQSEARRNTINSIAQKGWKFNSELIH